MDLRFPHKSSRTIEIRDVIHGTIELRAWEISVIEHPFFQRLRNIRQLGFSELAYPCATHNRYTHSIGAMYLAGKAFKHIFRNDSFSSQDVFWNFYHIVRLATLLHDVGHGPLSHSTEFAMPKARELGLPDSILGPNADRQCTHEDYTLKLILSSSLTPLIDEEFSRFEISPMHLACLIDKALPEPDDFFIDKGISYRRILSQIVSSEIDADRMDYLQRDSYYTGVTYGSYDLKWMLSSLTFYVEANSDDPNGLASAALALSNRAIYTFEDFLLSRYHMFLMVYYHYRSVGYEQMLEKYLQDPNCSYALPTNIEDYVHYDDNHLYLHLRHDLENEWAQRIATRNPYHLSFEVHSSPGDDVNMNEDPRVKEVVWHLKENEIPYIITQNRGLLSKYSGEDTRLKHDSKIFIEVNDRFNEKSFMPLDQLTELFQRYQNYKEIVRIYTPKKVTLQQ